MRRLSAPDEPLPGLGRARSARRWTTGERKAGPALPVQAGRYHLYVSLACPWCHRTVIVRELAGIGVALEVSYVAPFPRRKWLGIHGRVLRGHAARRRRERRRVRRRERSARELDGRVRRPSARLAVHVRGLPAQRSGLPRGASVSRSCGTPSRNGSSTTSRATSSACSPARSRSAGWASVASICGPGGSERPEDRRAQRAHLRYGQQRCLPHRFRAAPALLRAGLPRAVREL